VNQMGKTHSKPLAAGMAGERHGRGMGTACYMWIGLNSAPIPHTSPARFTLLDFKVTAGHWQWGLVKLIIYLRVFCYVHCNEEFPSCVCNFTHSHADPSRTLRSVAQRHKVAISNVRINDAKQNAKQPPRYAIRSLKAFLTAACQHTPASARWVQTMGWRFGVRFPAEPRYFCLLQIAQPTLGPPRTVTGGV